MSTTNGNQRPIDPELISAFYDGETTPEERAAVEESMDEAGRTLQMLDDYDQLSQSLKQLHRSSRAPDLKARVLAEIQPPATPVPAVAPARRRRLLSVVAGLTGLAAAVTLLLWPQENARHEMMVADNEAAYEFTATQPAESMAASSEPAPSAADADGAAPMAEAGRMAPASIAAPMSAADVTELEANVTSSLAEIASQQPLPEVGDVMGYLAENADELTWVAVTVVDVQQAGDQVQLLLSRHGVASAETDESAPDPPPGADNQVTFVVEANWDQMEAVIVDLSESSFIDSLRVNAPQDEGVPEELQGYVVERSTRRTSEPLNGNLQAEQLKRRVAGRQKQESGGGFGGGRMSADGTSGAVQLQLLVPASELQRIAARRGTDPALAAANPDAAAESVPAAPAESNSDKDEAPARATAAGQIGRVLASPRFKGVIVIQQQNR